MHTTATATKAPVKEGDAYIRKEKGVLFQALASHSAVYWLSCSDSSLSHSYSTSSLLSSPLLFSPLLFLLLSSSSPRTCHKNHSGEGSSSASQDAESMEHALVNRRVLSPRSFLHPCQKNCQMEGDDAAPPGVRAGRLSSEPVQSLIAQFIGSLAHPAVIAVPAAPPVSTIIATRLLCRGRQRASRPGISIILATTFSSFVRSAAGGTALCSPSLLQGFCHLASATRNLSLPSSSATAILRMDPGSSEEYVRLRSQRDGGQFVVPVACLVEMSATMKGEAEIESRMNSWWKRRGVEEVQSSMLCNACQEGCLKCVSPSPQTQPPGMFETDAFRENECLVDVPKSSITNASSSSSSTTTTSLHLRGGTDTSTAENAAFQSRPLVVAVDGPAASGKGTLSRRLAERLNFAHLDTGSLYRATALRVMRAGLTPEESVLGDEPLAAAEALNITPEDLRDPDLRQERVGQAASLISACPAVRKALLDYQHGFCRSPPGDAAGAVLDGRDIGTVIWPQAQVPF